MDAEDVVAVTAYGQKFHLHHPESWKPTVCGGYSKYNLMLIPLEDAVNSGYSACGNCFPIKSKVEL